MKLRQWKKRFKSVLIVPLFLGMILAGGAVTALAAQPGDGVVVKPARATWSTGFFLEALYSRALEELGYEVEDPKKLSNPIFYQSLYNGDVDFWANGWFPIHYAQMPRNWERRIELAGTIVKAGAIQGYLVSKKAVEEYNIKTVADFKRPEVKKAFDANGDGKADLVACPPGWGCEKVITFHLKAYGLRDHVNPIKASYSASMADALARYNQGQPVFFYTWTPNWTVFKLKPGVDVLWIGVPEIIPTDSQKGLEDALVQKNLDGAVSDPIKMGWTAADIKVVAAKDFLEENPAAAKMFEVMSVPLPDIAKQNNRMFGGENSQEDIENHVTEWIALNQAKWDRWLNQARMAAR